MSTPENTSSSDASAKISNPGAVYTAFWPLVIILGTVLLISGFELIGLLNQRQQIKALSAQLAPKVQQARVLSGTLGNLSKELVLLSGNSNEAKKIVKDFGIQVRANEAAPSKPAK